jgi:hypothetical protein
LNKKYTYLGTLFPKGEGIYTCDLNPKRKEYIANVIMNSDRIMIGKNRKDNDGSIILLGRQFIEIKLSDNEEFNVQED